MESFFTLLVSLIWLLSSVGSAVSGAVQVTGWPQQAAWAADSESMTESETISVGEAGPGDASVGEYEQDAESVGEAVSESETVKESETEIEEQSDPEPQAGSSFIINSEPKTAEGSSQGSAEGPEDKPSGESGGTSSKEPSMLVQDGVLTVGITLAYPPLEFYDDQGEITGFDPALAEALAAQMGLKARIVPVEWDALFPGLTSGRFDVVISGVTYTDERSAAYRLSKPYLYDRIGLIYFSDTPLFLLPSSLKGKNVAVPAGIVNEAALESALAKYKLDVNILYCDDMEAVFEALISNKADFACSASSMPAYYLKGETRAWQTYDLSLFMDAQSMVMVMRKDNEALETALETAMQALRDSNQLSALAIRYFGTDSLLEK